MDSLAHRNVTRTCSITQVISETTLGEWVSLKFEVLCLLICAIISFLLTLLLALVYMLVLWCAPLFISKVETK